MEGVPRLAMLSFKLKTSPETSDFGNKIKWLIREHFNEDPKSYSNEIREIEGLRASACHPPIDFSGCAILKKYFCQLQFLQNRFNFDENGNDDVVFPWNDVYTGMSYSVNELKHEMSCILYNIGALHTILGAMDNRQMPEGMKMSCTHFQCAAWAFQHLNDQFRQPKETDLSPDVINFMVNVSLAQAQECILEKSMVDGRKAGIVSKVAAQIVDFYKISVKILEQGSKSNEGNPVADVVGPKTYKSWKKYVEFKMTFYQCVSLLYMGIQCEELQKMGERVAFFQVAMDKLMEATKLSKNVEQCDNINDAVSFAHDVVGGKLKAAEKENEFVYHEKVPDKNSLSDIKGASLVKGIPFSVKDPEVSGQDIFQRLIPMEAHETSSLYSEEKAKLLRRIGASIEEKDQELALFLTSLQVDQLKLHSEPQALPQELVDRCAAFSLESNAVETLIESMSKLSSVYTDVEAALNEVQQLFDEEQEKEKAFQNVQGKRPPSMILKELSLEAARYKEAHSKAAESNMLLHKAINSHLGNLRTLSLPLSEIQAQLPSLQILESAKDQAAIKELQRLLDKVEEMRKQRVMFYNQFRESIQADDITKLATHSEDRDALFAQELSKHHRLTSLIEQNLSAQEKILIALTEANARYADTRRATADIQHRRASTVAALLASAEAYQDLLMKANKGIEFYRKMESNLTKLLQRLRSVCKVQQEEREQHEAARHRPTKTDPRPGDSEFNMAISEHGTEGPKLRDYLHLMKKDRADVDSAMPTALPFSMDSSYSFPNQRPAPVGAEQNESQVCGVQSLSTKHLPDYTHGSFPYQQYHTSSNPSQNPSFPSVYTGPYTAPQPAIIAPVTTTVAGNQANWPSNYLPSHQYYPSSSIAYTMSTAIPATNLYTAASGTTMSAPQHTNSPVPIPMVSPTRYDTTTNTTTALPQQPYTFGATTGLYYSDQSTLTGNQSGNNQPQNYLGAVPKVVDTYGQSYKMPPYKSTAYGYPSTPSSIPLTNSNEVASVTIAHSHGYHPANVPSSTTVSSYQYGSSSDVSIMSGVSASVVNSSVSGYSYSVSSATSMPYTAQNTLNGGVTAYQYPVSSVSWATNNIATTTNSSSSLGYPYTNTVGAGISSSVNCNAQIQSQYPYGVFSISSNSGQLPMTQGGNSSVSLSGGTTTTASDMQQYQQYSYYPGYPIANASEFQSGVSNVNFNLDAPQVLQPMTGSVLGVANANSHVLKPTPATVVSFAGDTPAASENKKVPSNVELLSLLDLSVPSTDSALLEPMSHPALPMSSSEVSQSQEQTPEVLKTTVATSNLETSPRVTIPPDTTPATLDQSSVAVNTKEITLVRPLSRGTIDATKDPFTDPDVLSKFSLEVEKFDKLVDGLTRKSLNGPTPLDLKWKEVQDLQDKESSKRSISVARCYPMKNRLPDVLPYDHNRVELPTTKDDYINASKISPPSSFGPGFIVTQCPLACTLQDFWTMIWEQQIEILICLQSDAEMKSCMYWPTEKGRDEVCGTWTISLQSCNVRPYSTERILTLTKQGEIKQNRVLIHLQFTAWPGNSFPSSPVQFLQFTADSLHFWKQQRNSTRPIVVHCFAGAGRTGLFCLVCAALAEIIAGQGLIDVVRVAGALCQQRRNMFRDREHLLFAYQVLLYHAQDLLMKRGILSGKASLQGSPAKLQHSRHPSQDFIQNIGLSLTENKEPVKPEEITASSEESVPTAVKEMAVEPPTKKPEQMLSGALAILDPANFTLDSSKSKVRLSKESFLNKNSIDISAPKDPNDPLSQLDPLWSFGK